MHEPTTIPFLIFFKLIFLPLVNESVVELYNFTSVIPQRCLRDTFHIIQENKDSRRK